MKQFCLVAVAIVGFCVGVMDAQAPPAAATVQAPAAPTELEQARMQIASLLSQLNEQSKALHRAEEDRDALKMQLVLTQSTPLRDGFDYDWSVGQFRDKKTGMIWDFEKKALVADAKTPKKDGGSQ